MSLVRRFIRGFVLAFDLREALELLGVDLGNAMLDGRSNDFIGVLAIAHLAIDIDELTRAYRR